MSWEFQEGHCAQCGERGEWLEFVGPVDTIRAQRVPPEWFVVDIVAGDATLLCSVKCVERYLNHSPVQGPQLALLQVPPARRTK